MNSFSRPLLSSAFCAAACTFAALPALAMEDIPPAPAPKPAGTTLDMKVPTLKLSAVSFFNYGYTFAGEDAVKKQNGFNMERVYINVEPTIDEHWSARITPDLAKPDAAGKNYTLRLKFAFIDGKKLGDTGFGVRAGMMSTPFAEPHDKAWGFRVLAKTPLDHFGVVSTADLGASVGYAWEGGEARLFIVNGEGYEYIETTLGKDMALQVNQELTKGLNLYFTALYGTWLGGQSKFWKKSGEVADPDDSTKTIKVTSDGHFDQRLITALLLTWDSKSVRAGLEGAFIRRQHEKQDAVAGKAAGDDGKAIAGLSATLYAVPRIGDKMEIPIRVVRFDPNMDSDTGKDDESLQAIVGYAYTFAGQLKLVPNVQLEKKGKDDAAVTGFVHLEGKL